MQYVLDSRDLWAKCGFGDGDMFADFMLDNYGEAFYFDHEDEFLLRVVRKHLMPHLPGVTIHLSETSHNPVRADDYAEGPPGDEPTLVDVTEAQLREIADEIQLERKDISDLQVLQAFADAKANGRVVSIEAQGAAEKVTLQAEPRRLGDRFHMIYVDESHHFLAPLIPEKAVAHARARDAFLGSLRKRRGGY